MEAQEKAQDRIQAICDKIRTETLHPAKQQAEEILLQARTEAERIIKQAKTEAEHIKEDAYKKLEQEKAVFLSSLEQASKQTIESLKQKIEKSLFQPAIDDWLKCQLGGAEHYAQLISVLVAAIQKEGIHCNLRVAIPKEIPSEAVNAKLSQAILEKLRNNTVEVANIGSGIRVGLEGKHLTIDLTQDTLKEIFSSYIRKDFRKLIFGS